MPQNFVNRPGFGIIQNEDDSVCIIDELVLSDETRVSGSMGVARREPCDTDDPLIGALFAAGKAYVGFGENLLHEARRRDKEAVENREIAKMLVRTMDEQQNILQQRYDSQWVKAVRYAAAVEAGSIIDDDPQPFIFKPDGRNSQFKVENLHAEVDMAPVRPEGAEAEVNPEPNAFVRETVKIKREMATDDDLSLADIDTVLSRGGLLSWFFNRTSRR